MGEDAEGKVVTLAGAAKAIDGLLEVLGRLLGVALGLGRSRLLGCQVVGLAGRPSRAFTPSSPDPEPTASRRAAPRARPPPRRRVPRLVRALELASRRGDQWVKGAAAQNLGIVCQLEGEAARKQGNEARAREHFTEAARFAGESLAVWRESRNEPNEAASHGQLGQIHFLLGDLDKAQEHAGQAREIRERLGLKEAGHDYDTLADIARARGAGHEAEAAAWEQKRDALVAELRRRAGAPALPLEGIAQLAVACAQAGLAGEPLGAAEKEALATIASWPAPLDRLVPFLRALASGEQPSVPAGLPEELGDVLEQVLRAVREARAGG